MTDTPSHQPDASDHHGDNPWLAHHFDSAEQQFFSAKLGMWIFLLTEVLFFSGLFCAYAVYRANHPEMFHEANQLLNRSMGAINTVVLITSSLTMAWAVRCAQLNQRRMLITMLSLTLCLAGMFLVVKFFEYREKWEHGLLWGQYYNPQVHAADHAEEPAHDDAGHAEEHAAPAAVDEAHGDVTPPADAHAADAHAPTRDMRSFFTVYFGLTGLHGVHVIVGMIAISWLLIRAVKGHFSSQYFEPVDCIGLYWHLVDLIWIYLFPLLYLIG